MADIPQAHAYLCARQNHAGAKCIQAEAFHALKGGFSRTLQLRAFQAIAFSQDDLK